MAERVQIATMGKYEPERLKFVLFKRKWDKLVILHSSQSKENAEMIKEDIGGQMPVCLKEVNPWDYQDVLATALEVAYKYRKYDLSFNASLGTRVMTVALHMAGAFSNSPVYLVRGEKNDVQGVVELQPIKRMMLTLPKKNILGIINKEKDGCILQKRLGSRAELGASTISGHVNELEKARYITKRRERDGNILCITDLGRIVLRAAGYWKKKK